MDVNVKKIKDNGGKENGWIIIILGIWSRNEITSNQYNGIQVSSNILTIQSSISAHILFSLLDNICVKFTCYKDPKNHLQIITI